MFGRSRECDCQGPERFSPTELHIREDSSVPTLVNCSGCSVPLLEDVVSTSRFLTWDRGLIFGHVLIHKCPQFIRKTIGCWSFMDVLKTTLRNEVDPAQQLCLPVMPHPRVNAVGAIQVHLLEMYSLLLVHCPVRARSLFVFCDFSIFLMLNISTTPFCTVGWCFDQSHCVRVLDFSVSVQFNST